MIEDEQTINTNADDRDHYEDLRLDRLRLIRGTVSLV